MTLGILAHYFPGRDPDRWSVVMAVELADRVWSKIERMKSGKPESKEEQILEDMAAKAEERRNRSV